MNLNYNKHITRDHIDWDNYNAKFEYVDKYRSKQGDPEMLHTIMSDPTMFAYLFFRLNGQPIKSYPYQDMLLNDRHRYKIFRSARQLGKSLCLDISAAYNLCINHGYSHNECIISKSLPQATFQMRRVKQILNSMDLIDWQDSKGDSDSMSVVTVDIKDSKGKVLYTNMLVVAPCTEAALGYDFHKVNLDEIEYWDIDVEHFWKTIIFPTITTTKGSITTFSNPNGQDSFIAELEDQTLPNGNKMFHTYVFNYYDKPGASEQEFEEYTAGLTRQQIESQYLAIRSLSDRNWFTNDEIDKSCDTSLTELKMVGQQPFFFLDVGAKKDRSVLVGGWVQEKEGTSVDNRRIMELFIPIIHCYPVGYPISRVVGSYDSSHDTDGWHVEKSVKDYLEEWSKDGTQPVFGVDVTGNSGISPLFATVGINPVDVTFSVQVKSGMYQRFKYYMEKGLLHRIKNKQFEHEASHLIMKKSARGHLMIHHEKEDDHDDVMDSVAGLIHLTDRPDIVTPGVTILK